MQHISSSVGVCLCMGCAIGFACYCKTLCIYVLVFVFHLSGTFSRDFPYPAPGPPEATQREGRGEAGMTDSIANSHQHTPVLVTLICAEETQPQLKPCDV